MRERGGEREGGKRERGEREREGERERGRERGEREGGERERGEQEEENGCKMASLCFHSTVSFISTQLVFELTVINRKLRPDSRCF